MDAIKSQNFREFLKEELKKILKIFLLIYIFLFLVIVVSSIIGKANNNLETKNPKILTESSGKETIFIEKPNSISIPKINIEAPIIFVKSTRPEDFLEPLKKGVTHYPSALPGEAGRTIILGHSAPPGWPKTNFNWVFSDLNKLEEGDEVFIFFNNQKYRYLVKEKIFLKKGQDLPPQDAESFSELILISCWPPGIDNKRIGVLAELQ